jgi:hypothetical protein
MKDEEIRYHIILMCREIKRLLKSGEESDWFVVSQGLCSASIEYSDNKGLPLYLIKLHMRFVIFRGEIYPFNDNSSSYHKEMKYENPKRLAFINEWSKKRLPKI